MKKTLRARSQIWILSRGFKNMFVCERESQTTNIINLQRYCNKNHDWRTTPSWSSSSKYKHEYVQNKIDILIKEIKVIDDKNWISSLIPLLNNSIQTQTIEYHEEPYLTYHINWINQKRQQLWNSYQESQEIYIILPSKEIYYHSHQNYGCSKFQYLQIFQIKSMNTPWCYQKIFRQK